MNLRNKIIIYLLLIVNIFLFSTCSNPENDKIPQLQNAEIKKADTLKVSVLRLDKDLFGLNPDNIKNSTPEMIKKYGNFYAHYVKGFLNNGGVYDSSYAYSVKQFITNKDMRDLYEEAVSVYPDFNFLENDLANAFNRFKFYFPGKHIPKVAAVITGFNYSIMYSDSVIGISTEMYLGSQNKFYQLLPPDLFPGYRRRTMSKQYMLPDCIKGWLTLEFPVKEEKSDFLSTIVNLGKTLYLVDALLPEVHDTLKMSYTKKQLDWCDKNEYNMWAYFIEKKVLFTTDYNEILRYIGDGPFTAAFNKESPSRVGTWIGWQIVRAYMKNNPDVTLQQLLDETDAQKILNKSKYKPIK